MRNRLLFIALLLVGCCRITFGQVQLDTIDSEQLTLKASDDDLLFSVLARQKREQARLDSIRHEERLRTDTTMLNPFHVGYADSLRIDSFARAYPCYALTLPLLYVPITASFEQMASADTLFKADMPTLFAGVRRYITAHAADLYCGVYDSTYVKAKDDIFIFHADLSHGLKIGKSLIADPEEDRQELQRKLRDMRTPWHKNATIMLQITQNYVSKNWYAGGNSSFALLAIAQGSFSYDDKDKIRWENTGEWRAGVNTVSGDSLRKINMNDDMFRLYSKFGYKMFNKVYLSVSAEFQAQLFNTWKDNTRVLKTGPLTPIRFNLALGADYKPVKGLSIVFSPLTYKMVYANDTLYADPALYGIPKGQRIINEAGSSLRVEWHWVPVREITLDSKFYLYTNYKRVEIDLEIVGDFMITRYLSARITLHPRYDNTVILPADERAKVQFKEMISLGFAHKFR
ncbi:MAG: DUF3078 domain-containing protein [Paludibacteraceae bacterium]|nr:DUF3078 domain-containing protein [Paludibacteraceae bacterium]